LAASLKPAGQPEGTPFPSTVPTVPLLLMLADATATLGANVRSNQYTLLSVVLSCKPLMPFEPESVTVALVTLTWA